MFLGLNWVDLIIIITLIGFAIEALNRSLIIELLDFISFLLAFFLSFRYYNLLALFFERQFQIPHGLSLVLGFLAVWFLSEIIFYLIVRILIPKLPKWDFNWMGILSVIPAFFKGFVFIALTLVLLATFPIQPAIKKGITDSRIGSLILKKAYGLEQPVKNVFGGVSSETLTFLTIKPQTNESINLGFTTDKYEVSEVTELAMIDLVNSERIKRDLKVLRFSQDLRKIAREHSVDMFKRGYFSHYSPEGESVADRATKAEIDFLVIGENLAYAPSLELAHKGLMNSEGHRANILSEDYGRVGIGVIDGGVYGKMFVQVFTN